MKRRLSNTNVFLETSDFSIVSTPIENNIIVGDRVVVRSDLSGDGDFSQTLLGEYSFTNNINFQGEGTSYKVYVGNVDSIWFSDAYNENNREVIKATGSALIIENIFNPDSVDYQHALYNNGTIGTYSELNKDDSYALGILGIPWKNFWSMDIFASPLQNSTSFSSLLFKLQIPWMSTQLDITGTSISASGTSTFYYRLFDVSSFDSVQSSEVTEAITPIVCAGISAKMKNKSGEDGSVEVTFTSLNLKNDTLQDKAHLLFSGIRENITTYDLYPEEDNKYSIGTSTYKYKELHTNTFNTTSNNTTISSTNTTISSTNTTIKGNLDAYLTTLYKDDVGGLFHVIQVITWIYVDNDISADTWNTCRTQIDLSKLTYKRGDLLQDRYDDITQGDFMRVYCKVNSLDIDGIFELHPKARKLKILGGSLIFTTSDTNTIKGKSYAEKPTIDNPMRIVFGALTLNYQQELEVDNHTIFYPLLCLWVV